MRPREGACAAWPDLEFEPEPAAPRSPRGLDSWYRINWSGPAGTGADAAPIDGPSPPDGSTSGRLMPTSSLSRFHECLRESEPLPSEPGLLDTLGLDG